MQVQICHWRHSTGGTARREMFLNVWPGLTKEQDETEGGAWNAGTEKPDPSLSLPHAVTINGFQVLLSNITCLPPTPQEEASALLDPHQYTSLIQSANAPQDPCPPLPAARWLQKWTEDPAQLRIPPTPASLSWLRCSNSVPL